MRESRAQHGNAGARTRSVFAQMAPEKPGARLAVEQAEHVARHCVEGHALTQTPLDLEDRGLYDFIQITRLSPEESPIDAGEHRRRMIRRAAHHDSVHEIQMPRCVIGRRNATIENDCQIRILTFDPMDELMVE